MNDQDEKTLRSEAARLMGQSRSAKKLAAIAQNAQRAGRYLTLAGWGRKRRKIQR